MNIAILLTNTDRSALAQRHPDDARKVAAWLCMLRPDWHCTTYRACDGELPALPLRYDAVVIPGSVASVNDDAAWIANLLGLIRQGHAQQVPMAGLCFGHQALARALGGQVGPNPGGFRLGVATTRFDTHPLAPHGGGQSPSPPPALALYAAHEEQVLQPPPGARVLGGDAFCPVGAMTVGAHVLSTQYHPELSQGFMRELALALASWQGPQATAASQQQIERQAVNPLAWMTWVVRFIEQAAARRAPDAAPATTAMAAAPT